MLLHFLAEFSNEEKWKKFEKIKTNPVFKIIKTFLI